ncbi:hypothetical protein JQ038_07180 [Clostridium botulinum]|nr:hypothetical protein [Clostridium botulinum]MCS4482409.1 hypothetical protein [Clostridium botulinum]
MLKNNTNLKQYNLAINDGVKLFSYCPSFFMDLLVQLVVFVSAMDLSM